jgi:hypothetical protein
LVVPAPWPYCSGSAPKFLHAYCIDISKNTHLEFNVKKTENNCLKHSNVQYLNLDLNFFLTNKFGCLHREVVV